MMGAERTVRVAVRTEDGYRLLDDDDCQRLADRIRDDCLRADKERASMLFRHTPKPPKGPGPKR